MNNIYVISGIKGNYEMLSKTDSQIEEVDNGPKTYVLMPNAFGGNESELVLKWIVAHGWKEDIELSKVVLVQGKGEIEFCTIYEQITAETFMEIEMQLRNMYFPGKKEPFSFEELEMVYRIEKSALREVFVDMYPKAENYHIMICMVDNIREKDSDVRGIYEINYIIESELDDDKLCKYVLPNIINHWSEKILIPESEHNISVFRLNDMRELYALEEADTEKFFCENVDVDYYQSQHNQKSLSEIYHTISALQSMSSNTMIDLNYRENFMFGQRISYDEADIINSEKAAKLKTR